MKKLVAFCFVSALWIASSSFSGKRGGDMFAIYLNGKQVLQQFVHADHSVKTLSLISGNEKDRIDVYYSHCGQPGKNRVLTVRNEKVKLIRKLAFGNGKDDRSLMGFTRRELRANETKQLRLYYTSDELPGEKLLAILDWRSSSTVAK